MFNRHRLFAGGLLAVVIIGLAMRPGHQEASAQPPIQAEHVRMLLARELTKVAAHSRWLASWGAAPQAPSPARNRSSRGFKNQSLREVTLLSSSGAAVRVHLSNAYGRQPLVIGDGSVAMAGVFGRLASRPEAVTFGGSESVTIPAGGSVVSDPVLLNVHALERLAVSLYLPESTGPITYHGTAEQLDFLGPGDDVSRTGSGWTSDTSTSWYVLSGVDTLSPSRYAGTVAAIGDSITAGYRSTVNTFGAWPDDLARRFARLHGRTMAVIDEGISGNRLLNPSPCCGASGLTRFDTDVRDQAGVRDVILLEGINDIGFSQDHTASTLPHTDVSAAQIIDGDRQMIAAAHAAGLRIYGATLLPFKGAGYWTEAGESKRDAVNTWIRDSRAFDGVIDFASVMAAPGHPQVLNPVYSSGDHLHPNNAGYARMANTIQLAMLTRAARPSYTRQLDCGCSSVG